jgi:5-(carboxyamino)imidazole ribonucleotide synthase
MISPGSWLGLLGGGQLGRMFCMAAQSMGYKVLVLDPASDGPAASVADAHIAAGYLDHDALAEFARRCRGATTEFENVPAASLEFLRQHIRVTPAPESVAIAQHRIREKRFLADHGFAVTPFAILRSPEEADSVDEDLLPGILKSARFGYDGKGQVRVKSRDEIPAAFREIGTDECVLEKFVRLARELSVIVARTAGDEAVTWPVAENQHRDGILDLSIVPARIAEEQASEARRIALGVARALDYVGVLCVEMFVRDDGSLLVNEIAPRPHNSGHYSIDACVTSQFEQQVRVLAGLPLGAPEQVRPAVMVNILGDVWFDGQASREPAWESVLRHPEVKLHLYGKAEARPGRKMGHATSVAATLEEALAHAAEVKRVLGIPG